MLKVVTIQEAYDQQVKQDRKKKRPVGKNVKKALKDYLRDYKGHGNRPLLPSPRLGKQVVKGE